MASSVTLKMVFVTASGDKTWSLKYANPELTESNVNSLMDTMITNGSIYQYPPLTKKSAKIQVLTETDFNIT